MKLSIITVNLNNLEGLKKTLKSIERQTYKAFEYIVIDGASTDGSVDIIKESPIIDIWISEKDSGVYDAMNKGIEKASGDYLLFLNSGDALFNDDTIKTAFPKLTSEGIVYGNIQFMEQDGNPLYIHYFPENLTFQHFYRQSLGHPSTFIRRYLFEKYGKYETKYTIVADWVFFTKVIIKERESTKYIPDVISSFYMDGMSSDSKNRNTIECERKTFLEKEFSLFYDDYIQYSKLEDKLKKLENKLERLHSSKGFRLLKALGVKKFNE
ncbi:glycosyltransferase family 2 protein [Sphingobacterium sp. SGR-19]|uniref:glycosyltransferase family 2 protein n=1 Tax=Sphingobacterium sp. SGR-19 TaxID=2710886 RepID=UPI0013ED5F11|nr:glycosyltransferase family 2 protein [Sphingobacterium sp. SGR-19]NGM64777.1 glycosyltransferase [Sphingobacterium sp. SGR-19]